jgi:hypothetical protein
LPTIWLPRELGVLVSDEDFEELSRYAWAPHVSQHTGKIYAGRLETFWCPVLQKKRRHKIYMHRQITHAPHGWVVDHRDRDTLNNQRRNLRITSQSFNNANRELGENECGYRGVSRSRNRYRARITFAGEDREIGSFATPIEAARAYDAVARELFGEFAWTNFEEDLPGILTSVTASRFMAEEVPF